MHARYLLYALPFFFALVLVELVASRLMGRRVYTWRESLASLAIGFGHELVGGLRLGAAGGLAAWVWSHRVAEVPLDRAWSIPLLFLAVEFFYYWYHRMSHEIRWIWASHSVHHSPTELNVLASFRLAWTNRLSGSLLFFMPAIWLGFDPVAVSITLALNLLYQAWVHTELIPKLGCLEGILNTPSAHRVHHASNPRYLDRNYGGVLLVFDRLFGTYEPEDAAEPCRYGLVKPVASANPLWIAVHEWVFMARDVVASRSLGDVLHHLFGRPGWRPAPPETIAEARSA